MTLEQYLNNSADQQDKLTDEELEAFWKPYLCVTRPELANPGGEKKRVTSGKTAANYEQSLDYKVKAAAATALAKQMGIDLKL